MEEHEQVSCSAGSPCTAVQLLTQTVGNHAEIMKEIKGVIDTLRNRLPLWATMAFSTAMLAIGFLISFALRK